MTKKEKSWLYKPIGENPKWVQFIFLVTEVGLFILMLSTLLDLIINSND